MVAFVIRSAAGILPDGLNALAAEADAQRIRNVSTLMARVVAPLFWENLGFEPVHVEGITHQLTQPRDANTPRLGDLAGWAQEPSPGGQR